MSIKEKNVKFVYEADHVKRILYVDNKSMERAGQITNPEFAKFMEIKNALPGYKVQKKEFPKKNKQTYAGLKIDVMKAFIIQSESDEQTAKSQIVALDKAKAEGLLKSSAYAAAKKWFLDNYGTAYNGSEMSKKDGKRDALINELLAKIDKTPTAPTVNSQKEGDVSNG